MLRDVNAVTVIPPADAHAVENWEAGLSAKYVAFVEHYYRYRNATQAYDHAFDARGGSYDTRRTEGSRVLNDPRVQKALAARIKLGAGAAAIDVAWLLNHFLSIAMADPRELIGLKVGACRYCYGVDHQYQWREGEYADAMAKVEREAMLYPDRAQKLEWPDPAGGFGFNATYPPKADCPRCHGEGVERFVPRDTDKLSDSALLLYGGVKVKKDGYEVIIADRVKAAELAGRILGAFTDKVKISGTIASMTAIADLRAVDPQEAAKAYREFIASNMT
jgi:phage terminase small subunit